MNKVWALLKTCKCPSVYECKDCKSQYPASQGFPKTCPVCDARQEEYRKVLQEAGERYWGEIGPVIATWDMAEPEGCDGDHDW